MTYTSGLVLCGKKTEEFIGEGNTMNTDKNECMVCGRIEAIKEGKNPYFVYETQTGYVVLGDYQYFKGYTIFICKKHADELFELEPEFRKQFLYEMSLAAEAVSRAFSPDKVNYELLGTGNATHMHWHIFPRRAGDTPEKGPVWKLPREVMYDEKHRPDPLELEELKSRLRTELEAVFSKPM